MDAFGLRPSLRALADDVAAAGYTVLVPNVFYRHGRAPLVELPDFIDPQQRPDLFATIVPMLRELTRDLVVRDAGAYLDWLTAFEHTADGPMATAGYCMGGRLTVYTAGAFGDRIAAAAGFHTGDWSSTAPTARISPSRVPRRKCISAMPTRTAR